MADVQVTVETPSENQIIAVEFDGQEIIQPPLSLSEHFAKQASRIDFNDIDQEQDDECDNEDTIEDEQEYEATSSATGTFIQAVSWCYSTGGIPSIVKTPYTAAGSTLHP